eukprot:1673688-Pyramimonas_sp.AAC.1
MLFLEVTWGGLWTSSWRSHAGPFTAVLRQDSQLNAAPVENVSVIDALGSSGALYHISHGSTAGGQIAVDLPVIRKVVGRIGTSVRW